MPVILADTRQQKGKHRLKNSYFVGRGYTIKDIALTTDLQDADYMFEGGQICVDTKANIQELAQCLKGDIRRFRRELGRIHDKGLMAIILTETVHPVYNLDDLEHFKEPNNEYYKRRQGYLSHCRRNFKKPVKWHPIRLQGSFIRAVAKTARTMESETEKYSVRFEFVHPKHAGQRVLEILEGENDEIRRSN